MENNVKSSAEPVSERVKWLREHLGLSQKEFAKTIDVLPTQLNNWETARQRLSLQGALKINERYGTSLDFLFLGKAETLPHTMHVAWTERPRVMASNKSSENPDA